MKPITVILLVMCGSLLLLVGVFAVFFARGGQVIVWSECESLCGGGLIEAEEEVAQEIANLDFTFSPVPALTVHFQGLDCRPWSRFREGKENYSIVLGDIKVTGKALRAIPSGREYYGISGEEFQKQLIREIQSRISEDSEFHFIVDASDDDNFREYPERFRQKN